MTHMTTTPIAPTTKGHRVWLQGLDAHGWTGGTTYSVQFTADLIVYTKATEGRVRKVTASKGGVIDTTSQKVTQWAQGSTQARVAIDHDTIIIMRERV